MKRSWHHMESEVRKSQMSFALFDEFILHHQETGLCFDVNKALVLDMRIIGRGQSESAAIRALNFLGLHPINKAYWMENTKRIEKEAKLIVEGELNTTACEVKEKKFGLGEVASSHEELHEKVRCWNQDQRFLVNTWLVGFSWSCCCYFSEHWQSAGRGAFE